MPKNKGKGGKNRRRGKNENESQTPARIQGAGQEYSQVVRMLGNGRCECYCFDGVTRLGHWYVFKEQITLAVINDETIGAKCGRRWVSAGDIVLVGLREYQDDKAR